MMAHNRHRNGAKHANFAVRAAPRSWDPLHPERGEGKWRLRGKGTSWPVFLDSKPVTGGLLGRKSLPGSTL